MNRRQALLSLVGLAPAAVVATPEPKPDMALAFVSPMCPRCGGACLFLDRPYDHTPGALIRVACGASCGWTGQALFGTKLS